LDDYPVSRQDVHGLLEVPSRSATNYRAAGISDGWSLAWPARAQGRGRASSP